MDRRRLLEHALFALPLVRAAAQAPTSMDLEETTIDELRGAMEAGRVTSVAATEWYLQRIDTLDRGGPKVNSVIEVNPDALKIAEALDRERAARHTRGPLHGVPVLIKDNIDTADRMQTTAGSLALAGHIAARDAFLVERLRNAGAVLLGKTNLSEWANFRSSQSVSGWSARGGLTRNPYVLDRNPCGSSSGSGAAASANFCAAAIGTETDGSVTAPASANCLAGIKPTVGLVGRSGIIPISASQDTAGPMTRSVRDAAILLGILAGADPRDASTAGTKAEADYTKFLEAGGLKGARIGVARKFFGFHAGTDRLMEEALAAMKKEGATVVDPADLPSHGQYDNDEFEVLLFEFKAGLNAYLSGLEPGMKVRSLAEVIGFNRQHREKEMPYFEQDIAEKAESRGALTDAKYREARARCVRLSRSGGIDAALRRHKLDAIVAPTTGPAPLTDLLRGDPNWGGCTTPPAVAGYPHVTVPAGFVRGLPVGISFFGTAWSEPVLLKLAYGFEQATQQRRKPAFQPSLPGA